MPSEVRSLYAIDPASRQVRYVVQVEPEGWTDPEVEPMLQALVQVAQSCRIQFAIAVSLDSSFVVQCGSEGSQLDIEEYETAEVLSPEPLHPDPDMLTATVEAWCRELAAPARAFLAMARLPRKLPNLLEIAKGSELRVRDGRVVMPSEVGVTGE